MGLPTTQPTRRGDRVCLMNEVGSFYNERPVFLGNHGHKSLDIDIVKKRSVLTWQSPHNSERISKGVKSIIFTIIFYCKIAAPTPHIDFS